MRGLGASIRGTEGHLTVFAVGRSAVLAVAAGPDVSPAWVHLHTRSVVEELAALSEGFERFGGPAGRTAGG